jgi:hypothetical protein
VAGWEVTAALTCRRHTFPTTARRQLTSTTQVKPPSRPRSAARSRRKKPRFDLRTFAPQAKLARVRFGGLVIAISVYTSRSGSVETSYIFNLTNGCILVRVAGQRVDATRGTHCSKQQRVQIALPKCSLSEIQAKHPKLNRFTWSGDTWDGDSPDLATPREIEDDC